MRTPFDIDAPHRAVWPRRVPAHLPQAATTLWDKLDVTARRYPDKDALIFFGCALSFQTLRQQCETLAGWLVRQAGVKPGDRVMLAMQNSPQFVIAYYAAMRVRAVVVTANPMSRHAEFAHYLADSGARVTICAADVAAEVQAAGIPVNALLVAQYSDYMGLECGPGQGVPPSWDSWLRSARPLPAGATAWSDAMAAGCPPEPYEGRIDDLILLGYTSGTTGQPKGCMHSHRSVGHNVMAGPLWSGACAADTVLSVLPPYHITGMQSGMNIPIYTGATVVLMPRWDRALAGHLIARHRVSSWGSISTMLIDLLASSGGEGYDLSSLRYIGGGGAAMPRAIAERLREQ